MNAKYMSFTINNKLRFIDSFQFLSSSLDSLVKNLSKDDFNYLHQEFDNNALDLVEQTGFYPYEYMSDFEKFKEELPCKEKFYSCCLTDRKITDKEYEHALNICIKFEMKTIKYYHDLYLKCDVSLLSDAFEKFRNNSLKIYGLCSSHYLSAPSLSWDAMLKMTKIEHDNIFFEKGTRGGISYISNRCSKANKKYLKYFDPKQESNIYI